MGNAQVGGESEGESTKKRKVIGTPARAKITTRFTWYYPNWEAYIDTDTAKVYYFNTLTNETSWDPGAVFLDFQENFDDVTWHQGDAQESNNHMPHLSDQTSFLRANELERKRKVQEVRLEVIKDDPFSPWKELCDVGQIDFSAIESKIIESKDIVVAISQGLYDPEMLYKLPWAYKVQQLGAAVKDCFLEVGDFFDSSKYDDCNEVPRYDDGGLVAWWTDLEELNLTVEVEIEKGVVGQESEKYTEEMKKLQAVIATSGNEEDILEGLLARRIQVEKELDNLRARYLKDNVTNDTDLTEIQDEMEEVVSNELEQKHRFMVDVVLLMGLLEDELERLERRINSYNAPPESQTPGASVDKDDSAPAVPLEEEVVDPTEALVAELKAEKDRKLQELYDNLSKQKQSKIDALVAQGMSVEEAELKVFNDEQAEIAAETERLDAMTEEALKKHHLDMLNKLKNSSEEQEAKLQQEMDAKKKSMREQLQERLAKRKQDRVKELIAEGRSEAEAEAIAQAECDDEELSQEHNINKEIMAMLQEKRAAIVESIRSEHTKSEQMLQSQLDFQKEEKSKMLKQRLEKRKELRVAELINNNVNVQEAVVIATEEAKKDLATEQQQQEAILKEKHEQVLQMTLTNIKSVQEEQNKKLENELLVQQANQKKSLQEKLKQREKKREQQLVAQGQTQESAREIAVKEQKAEEEKIMKQLEEDLSTIKQKQEAENSKLMDYYAHKKDTASKATQDRLAKRKAEKANKVISNEQKVEDYLSQLREKHKEKHGHLTHFIENEKNVAFAEAENDENIDVAKVALLFTVVKESLVVGFKKQCVYEVRSVKEFNIGQALNAEQHLAAMHNAAEQLIMRHVREQKSLLDSQLAEKQRAKLKLVEDGAPNAKIAEMEQRFNLRHVEAIKKQQTKAFMSLAGVYLDLDIIAPVSVTEEDDEEHYEFGTEGQSWFRGVLGLQNVYSQVPVAMMSRLEDVLFKIQSNDQFSKEEKSTIAPNVAYQLMLVVLKAVVDAFRAQVERKDDLSKYAHATANDIIPSLSSGMSAATANLTLETAFSTMDASATLQAAFRETVNDFMINPLKIIAPPAPAIVTKKTSEKLTPKSVKIQESNEKKREEIILKSFEAKIERKKREIKDKYRKRREVKLAECKENNTDLPPSFITEEEAAESSELDTMGRAYEDVVELVHSGADVVNNISADGLVLAVDKRIAGESVTAGDFKMLQQEVEKENEKGEAKRLLRMQSIEAEKLDVQRAREQQALQKRLLARKTKRAA